MKNNNQTPDAHNDIYSSDCNDSIKMQMAAMKANSEGIKANYLNHSVSLQLISEETLFNPEALQKSKQGPFINWIEERNEIDPSVIDKLQMRPFTYGIDFGFNPDNA